MSCPATPSMLQPPFSRLIVPVPSTIPLDGSVTTSVGISIDYTLPATIRRGITLARRADDPDAYYAAELLIVRLDEMGAYLWLAGLPSCSRPLHRQQLLGREIVITEDPNEHLVWHETRIFVKPLPMFLVDLDCWTQKICRIRQLHEAACGFLLSYAWLVRHESDFRIAREEELLPNTIDWGTWTMLIDDLLKHIDLQSLSGVSSRYHYGELRLSRLNKIHSLTRFTWRDFVRGYMTTSTWYQDFFARNFAWLLAVFAVVSVALSAMQVVFATTRGSKAFEDTSYGFSIASLFLAAGTALAVLLIWAILFTYHLAPAQMNNRFVVLQRKNYADSQGSPTC